MAEVAVTVKIYVEDMAKMESVKSSLSRLVKLQKSWEEDVGFGIKALKAIFLMEDAGGLEEIEEKIKAMEGVSEAQVENVDRI